MRELLADHDGDGLPDALQHLDSAKERQALLRDGPAKLENLRRARDTASSARPSYLRSGLLAAAVCAFFAILWMGAMQAAGTDPWLGGFAAVACPKVCSRCHGPLRYYHPTSEWYCSPEGENLVDVEWTVIDRRVNELKAQALPGRAWTVWLSSLFLFAPIAVFLTILAAKASAAAARGRALSLTREIEDLETRLREAGSESAPS